MTILVSDTSVIIDLERARLREALFALPHIFAVPDLLYERELQDYDGEVLVTLGLRVEALSGPEVRLAVAARFDFPGLSVVDTFALALAQERGWELLAGDGLLRKAAAKRAVTCRGVLWVFDQLHAQSVIPAADLISCLEALASHPRCRLPAREISARCAAYVKAQDATA